MFNLLLFCCYSYNFFFCPLAGIRKRVLFLQQCFTYVRIFVTYFLRTSELFIFLSQSFLELLQPFFLLFSGHFQTELNFSGESAVPTTGRILFQDLTSAVAGAEIVVLLHEGYVETLRLGHRQRERLGGLHFF